MINHGHTIETNLPTKNNIPEQMTLSLISKHRTIIPQKTRQEWYRLKLHPNLSDNEDDTEEHKKGHHITTTPPKYSTRYTQNQAQLSDQRPTQRKSNTNTMSEVEVAGTNTDLVLRRDNTPTISTSTTSTAYNHKAPSIYSCLEESLAQRQNDTPLKSQGKIYPT
jgi:hypothetical protein